MKIFLTCLWNRWFPDFSIHHLKKNVESDAACQILQKFIHGVEKKPLPHLLCITNMMLHGIEVPSQIRRDNSLDRPLKDYKSVDKEDVIIINPPFGGTEENGIETRFPLAYQTRETADLFLVLIIHLLKDDGRGAIVLPDGTLFGRCQNPHQRGTAHPVQPPHHRPPAQRRVRPLHRHQDKSPVLHQRRADQGNLVLRTPLSAGREVLQLKPSPSTSASLTRKRNGGRSARKTNLPGACRSSEIKESGYNLDIKNPHEAVIENCDPEELLEAYKSLIFQISETQLSERELMAF